MSDMGDLYQQFLEEWDESQPLRANPLRGLVMWGEAWAEFYAKHKCLLLEAEIIQLRAELDAAVREKEEAVKRTAEKCAEMAPTYEAAIRVEFGLLGAK